METREPTKNPFTSILTRIHWRAWLPSRGNVLFTLVIIFAMFWAQSARALPWMQPATVGTSTGTWPYQGRLANSAGTPITATVPMIFRLYNAPGSGATPLWEEQWTGPNSVIVSDGLFNVMLGSLTAIPQSIVNGNNSLWLGITAGTDNEMTPRVQLGSVPYAAQALTVPDGSITAAKLANTSITTAKITDANITTAKIGNGAVTLSKLGPDVIFTPPNGSVTTSKVADGAITGPKLDPNLKLIPTVFYAIAGNDVLYTPPADIFSLPFTLSKTSSMMVIVNIRALASNPGDQYVFLIKRDGVSVTSNTHLEANDHEHFSYSFVDMNVPSGSHQYTIAISMSHGGGQRWAHAPSITAFALP